MESHLQAGIAIYNAGEYHAAHDAWEDRWLELDPGTPDERFLHGLIQFTAAVYHGTQANWAGLAGLAESANEYLNGLGETYRGVALDPIRSYLRSLREDPERFTETTPPPLTYDGEVLEVADLDFPATVIAARVLAEEDPAYDERVLEAAITYAQEAVVADDHNRFVTLVIDFVREPSHRDIVFQRLSQLVARHQRKEADVDDLFDP